MLDDVADAFDELGRSRSREDLRHAIVVLGSQVIAGSRREPLVPDAIGMLPKRHRGCDDVVEEPVGLVQEAIEALPVLERPELDRRLGVTPVRRAEEVEQLIAVADEEPEAPLKRAEI